jgi:hypothetical protein
VLAQVENNVRGVILKKNDIGCSFFSKDSSLGPCLVFGLIQTPETDIQADNA